jgi:NRPS condensation-like uncharacterized protein
VAPGPGVPVDLRKRPTPVRIVTFDSTRQARRSAIPAVTDDPLGLVRALEASDRFRRDSRLGRILHRGAVSFREVSPTDSLHVLIDGNRVWAHVDRVSPLVVGPDRQSPRYSPARVLAHTVTGVAGVAGDVSRWLRGVRRDHRCYPGCSPPAFLARPAPAGPGTAAPRTGRNERMEFSPIDEAIHLLDTEAAPWSIQLEARVQGSLDEARLRAALGRALAAHPMARARKAPSRATAHRDTWIVAETPELDPLRVVDCPDDDTLAAARAELQSLAVPLAESPPLRVRLARHPGGDVVMMNVNHAAMDGFGVLRVLQSTARAYAGEPDPAPPVGLDEARRHPARLTSDAPAAHRFRRWLALAEKARDFVVPPARLAAEGATREPGYGFVHAALSESQTTALVDDDRQGATVNDVLLAALHLAIARWNADHGARCGRIGVLVPANLRPKEWRDDVAANFTLPARIGTTRRSRRDPARALRAVAATTGRKKESGMGTALLEVLRHSRLLPLWAKQALVAMLPLTGNRLVDTAMLSNVGNVAEADLPSFGASAGLTTELWFSPPARMPLGLSVGAVTADGRLFLSFRYRRRLFGPAAAARFVDNYLVTLAELGPD